MSKSYSSGERKIAQALSKFPGLKKVLKRTYQRVNFYLHKLPYSYKTQYQIQRHGDDTRESFFGYYDRSPESADGKYLLFHQLHGPSTDLTTLSLPVSLSVFELATNKHMVTLESKAYNLQQGCKPQWISNNQFIYNDFDSSIGKYVSHIYNLETNKKKTIPSPIYDVVDEKYALSLSFERLHQLTPEYGYRAHHDSYKIEDLENDGIGLVNLETGEVNLLFSLEQIVRISGHSPDSGRVEYLINHLMISPDKNHFIFIHRFFINGERQDQLFLGCIQDKSLKILANDKMVSHCFWKSSEEIISFMNHPPQGSHYYKINIISGEIEIFGNNTLNQLSDGHPSVFGKKLITDTYPNKARMKKLYLYDMESDDLQELGCFFEGMEYFGDNRCDLHPRFSSNGKKIYFDSVHEGKRALYSLNLGH